MSTIAEQLDQARRNELLDLTLRNRLISHKTLKSRGAKVIDERPVHVHRILVEEERKMSFLEVTEEEKQKLSDLKGPEQGNLFGQPEETGDPAADDDGTEEANSGPADRHVDTKLQTPYTSQELQKRLLNTFYHARRSIQEEGINTLFLALGMLRWYRSPSADTERKAPILLVPVELNRTDVQGRFRLEYLGEEIGGNLSLKAFLEAEYGLSWPLPPDPEEEALDLQAYARRIRSVIQNKERWSLDQDAIELGFFSFSRFLMYEDLDAKNWPDGEGPTDHPVLTKLLDEGFEPPETPPSAFSEGGLDEHLDPEDTYHVVDADSSQTEAILAVKDGQDLVLQGPPGTGKSQTITNIIAEAIGEGKTVLFASEKMAALEVVKRNLDSVGLGDACLELHSHKTRKKAVLKELERTLNLGRPQVEDFSQEAAVMTDARETLNEYAEAVNTPIGESGVRPYYAYGELTQLRETLKDVEVPSIDLPAMRTWDGQTYEENRFLVEQVQSHLKETGVPAEHPFWGSQKTGFLPADQPEIERAAQSATESLSELQATAENLADLLDFSAPKTPEETRRLLKAGKRALDAPDLTGVNVRAEVFSVQDDALSELVETGERLAVLHEKHDDQLIPEAWEHDVFDIRQGLAKHGGKWYRWIFSEWRAAKSDLAALCKEGLPSDMDARIDLADAILEAQRLEDTIEEQAALGEEAFGNVWRGTSSDWAFLNEVTTYLTELHASIREGRLPETLLSVVADPPDTGRLQALIQDLKEKRDAHEEATTAFAEAIELDAGVRFEEGELSDQSYAAQGEALRRCRKEAPRIQEMVTYNQLSDELGEEGLAPIRPLARAWDEAPDHLVDAFRHAYYNALLERAMDERPALKRFSGAQHEQVAERFRELDEASLAHNRHELALKHYEGLPPKSGAGQMGVLLHEMGKKSRHMPLRTLMQRAGNAVQAIKPVFMMSPMSVPKYLPPESIDFDLVVFDEASQVRPVDAFGSILRGDQTVVVGDNKQLPPTSFFDAAIDTGGDDFEKQAGDQESILDLFRSRGAPEQMLQFHYRSRHESLIAVSNKEFYDNNLNVFPSPDAGREDTGLVFNHLPDTTYDRGGSRKNKGEAEVVAQRVMEHARTEPEMSLGVATFSSAQQEAIRDRLEYERRQDPSCEDFFSGHPDEPFFVKNLESVQGDQRDVIFISVGYGRDDNGKVSMNFGPLNQQGGERRLNVLTTRAKHRCEVFTNLRGDDIDLHRTDARGVEVLKEYLTFAETGELDLPTPTGRGPDSPFEEAVAERLRAEGYRVEHQVGVAGFYIDLAVVDPDRPGRYVLGIECDGATYHSAKMARVRDRTRQAVLENLGWTIHRIWSTDWFRQPGEQLGQAVAAIERAKVEPTAASDGSAAPSGDTSSNGQTAPSDAAANQGGFEDQGGPEKTDGAATSSPERSDEEDHSSTSSGGKNAASGEDTEKRSSQEAPSQEQPSRDGTSRDGPPQERETEIQRSETEDTDTGAPPYERATLDIHVREGLRDEPTATIGQWIETVVAQEGPVHEEVAMRRVLDATDVSRMGNRIREALEDGIRYADRQGWIKKSEEILFDPGQSTVSVRDRSDLDGPARDIHHVPNLEIAAAAREIADISFGIEKEELIRETGRTLGFNRIGSNIQNRIGSVIDAMIEQDQLVSEDGHLRVPE